MSKLTLPFVIDANVFIQPHRQYYPFDICPGYWAFLEHHFKEGNIISIDKIKGEIIDSDELSDWVLNQIPSKVFYSTRQNEVSKKYAEIIQWVQSSSQFHASAKAEFANDPDGWLVAYAKAHNLTITTQEVYIPGVKNKIPIPNLCREFNIECIDIFNMLRQLKAKFHWNQ